MRTRSQAYVVTLALAVSMVGGCAFRRSRPARTYVLDPLATQGAPALSLTPVAAVGVLKVTVPGWIDRPQVAARAASGEIVTDEFARWAEPVTRGVQRVLVENLAALLPDRRVVAAPFAPGEPIHHRVEVTLTEAARQPDGSVLVEARWAVLGDKGATLVQRRFSHRAQPPPPGLVAAVSGLNEALASLSRDVAEALPALPVARAAEGDVAGRP